METFSSTKGNSIFNKNTIKTYLENAWNMNQYPDQTMKLDIVKQLGPQNINYKQVTSWFKHRRENDKAKRKFEYRFSPTQKFSNDHVNALEIFFQTDPYPSTKVFRNYMKCGCYLHR